jgi:hypothetical protein
MGLSALRFPPASLDRFHTDSGLHPCHQFSGSICSPTTFGGFYLGGKRSAKLFKGFINGVHVSILNGADTQARWLVPCKAMPQIQFNEDRHGS